MSEKSPKAAPASTRRAILEILKRDGPQDARDMARRLRISTMAVRQHLYALAERNLVANEEERRPMGRPAKLWRLTQAANGQFPDAHADLTLSLIQTIRETFGEKGMDRLIGARSRDQAKTYAAEVPPTGPLRKRLEALAKIRAREGYMAEVESAADGTLLLIENHCPICVAASSCTNLCAGELAVFRKVLGRGVRIERIDHILAGARRCAYTVSAE